jgi:hypothetical protein
MAAITSQNVAQAIVKLVASEGLSPLMGAMVMGNLVNRSYEPTLANAGDTVNIPIPPVMSTNNISEGGSVQTQNPNLGNAQIVLNTHAEATFVIPDVTAALVGAANGDMSLISKYMRPAMIALAERIETDLLNLYTNVTVNSAVGTGGTALNENTIDAAEKSLFDAKVPLAEEKYLVLSSQAYSDTRQIMRFSEQRTIGSGDSIITGDIPRIKDFNVFRSQFVAKPSSTTYNLGFARDAFGLVIRRLPQPLPGTGAIAEYAELGSFGFRVVMSYQPTTLAQQFTVDCLYGVAALRENFAVQTLS